MLKLTTDETEGQTPEIMLSPDELAREGAGRMIATALEVEVEHQIQSLRHLRDEHGHALVVRNGKSHHERTINLGAGSIKLKVPRVDDRRPEHRFVSQILPPYMRRSPRLEEALPIMYLRGLSTGDFSEALLGTEAAGFSATTITRLLKVWQEEYQTWRKRSLKGKEQIYLWADGVYFNIRPEEDCLACLVVVGVLPDGREEVIALEDGYRESTESWGGVPRHLKRRGMATPVLAVGNGNLGFRAALRNVYPETQEQRCWKHRIANVLDKLPQRLQPRAKEMLHEIMHAPDPASAPEDTVLPSEEYGARYPKAVETPTKDQDCLLAFFDLPAGHWLHLRTTHPIESTLATVKARTRKTTGAGSRKAGLAMAFKLLLATEKRWRKVNAHHLVAQVAAGVGFPDGQAEMFQPEPALEDLFIPTPWILAADELLVHSIRQCLVSRL